jgi:hypothetical protein
MLFEKHLNVTRDGMMFILVSAIEMFRPGCRAGKIYHLEIQVQHRLTDHCTAHCIVLNFGPIITVIFGFICMYNKSSWLSPHTKY